MNNGTESKIVNMTLWEKVNEQVNKILNIRRAMDEGGWAADGEAGQQDSRTESKEKDRH